MLLLTELLVGWSDRFRTHKLVWLFDLQWDLYNMLYSSFLAWSSQRQTRVSIIKPHTSFCENRNKGTRRTMSIINQPISTWPTFKYWGYWGTFADLVWFISYITACIIAYMFRLYTNVDLNQKIMSLLLSRNKQQHHLFASSILVCWLNSQCWTRQPGQWWRKYVGGQCLTTFRGQRRTANIPPWGHIVY